MLKKNPEAKELADGVRRGFEVPIRLTVHVRLQGSK